MKLFDLSQLRSVCFSSLPQASGQQQPRCLPNLTENLKWIGLAHFRTR
jgi:hypothetical protein